MAEMNLWGQLPTVEVRRTPYVILREQAALLGQMTENLLEGHVEKGREGSKFAAKLNIVAPTLDHYTYTVLHVDYPVALYPLKVWDTGEGAFRECGNDAEFVEAVGEILSSDRVKRVIAGLLSQIRSDAPTPA